uniref:Uncharacterized protein n=1 Tax=Pongo abelii TaxID=9601 RepID=H2P4Y1_PONAB
VLKLPLGGYPGVCRPSGNSLVKLAGRASVLEPCLLTEWTLPVLAEIIRGYAVYNNQHWRPHGFWIKKEAYPVEASEEPPAHKDRGDGERPVHARVVQVAPLRFGSTPCGDAVQDISKEDTVYDIYNEDAVDISDEDTVDISNEALVHDIFNDAVDISNEAAVRDISNDAVDICNEAAVHDISNEDTIEDISNEDAVYDIANEDTVQDICKKEDAASEPFILGNDLFLESISDKEDL